MFTIQHAKIHFNQENTPVSDKFDDVYFSNQDGLAETHYVFLEGNHVGLIIKRPTLLLLKRALAQD